MYSWNEVMEKVIEHLHKEHIEFKEVQGIIYVNSKNIKDPTVIYKPLSLKVRGEHNFICKFDKVFHNTDKVETVTREFAYFVPTLRYIKRFIKGELL